MALVYIVGICSTTLWPSNMKADHMRSSNFLALPKFGKYKKKTSKLFYSFSFKSEVMDVPHTTQLV